MVCERPICNCQGDVGERRRSKKLKQEKQLDVSVYQLRLSESSAIRMCVIFH